MPIRDSIYTNPDTLRLLYLNPRNPTREADQGQNIQITQGPDPDIITPPLPGCPALTEYVLACVGIRVLRPQPMPVQAVQEGRRLWNPIAKHFGVVAQVQILEQQECVLVQTFSGVECVTSLSSLGITSVDDGTGRSLHELIASKDDAKAGAMQWLMGQPNALECTISKIFEIGKRDVLHISLEEKKDQTPIYATGSTPLKMLCWHNKPPGQGSGGGGDVPLE